MTKEKILQKAREKSGGYNFLLLSDLIQILDEVIPEPATITLSQKDAEQFAEALSKPTNFRHTTRREILNAKELLQKLREWCQKGSGFDWNADKKAYELLAYAEGILMVEESLIQAQGEVEDRWIPVSERLPELNKDVLWLNKYGDMAVSCLEKGWTNLLRVQWGEAGMLELEYLTHWQPLPTPPRTKDKKEGE